MLIAVVEPFRICSSIKRKHPSVFMRGVIVLHDNACLHVACAVQDTVLHALEAVELYPIQPSLDIMCLLCVHLPQETTKGL
jgi:hypothetical protein